MIKHSEEFKQEAVRIALTSGLPRGGSRRIWGWQIDAEQMGFALSSVGLVAAPQADLARENERLRLENRVLREERES
jgi:transposase